MRKYLYFRTVADEANDGVTGLKTSTPSSFLFPADSLTAIQPTDDGVLTLYFKPALANNVSGLRDQVELNVNEGDHYEVMSAITDAIANPARGHSDGFIVIADDVATTDSAVTALNDLAVLPQYIHSSITSCGEIKVQSPSTYGYHRHYEVVDIPTGAIADDDVFATLSVKIPAQATLVEASINAVELSGSADASCALEVHTASIAANSSADGPRFTAQEVVNTAVIPIVPTSAKTEAICLIPFIKVPLSSK